MKTIVDEKLSLSTSLMNVSLYHSAPIAKSGNGHAVFDGTNTHRNSAFLQGANLSCPTATRRMYRRPSNLPLALGGHYNGKITAIKTDRMRWIPALSGWGPPRYRTWVTLQPRAHMELFVPHSLSFMTKTPPRAVSAENAPSPIISLVSSQCQKSASRPRFCSLQNVAVVNIQNDNIVPVLPGAISNFGYANSISTMVSTVL